jgi:hypothetical protein
MRELQRIQQAIREQRYRIGSHANEEMSDDDLEAEDIENILLAGEITRKYTHDPRSTRYEVTGNTADYRRACVICRFLPSDVLLIITAFVPDE